MRTTDHQHDATILTALTALGAPADAYALARRTGLTVPEAGRALLRLRGQGRVHCLDELDTMNDLAARFEATSQPRPSGRLGCLGSRSTKIHPHDGLP